MYIAYVVEDPPPTMETANQPDHPPPIEHHPDYGFAPGSIFLIVILAIAISFLLLLLYVSVDIGLWPAWWRRRVLAHENRGQERAQERHISRLQSSMPWMNRDRGNANTNTNTNANTNASHINAHEMAVVQATEEGRKEGAATHSVTVSGGAGSLHRSSVAAPSGEKEEEMPYAQWQGGVYAGPGTGAQAAGGVATGHAVKVQAPAPALLRRS